jgi:16S rRNA processing protein RimM
MDSAHGKSAPAKPVRAAPAPDKPALKRVLLGKIVGLFGVDGWVKVESYTEPRASIFRYLPWYLETAAGETEIASVQGRAHGKGLVAALPEVEDRDAALAWMGAEIWVPRSALPRAKRGEYYWIDLEGLDVVTAAGIALGKVSHLFATGANDVLVVRDGGRERMIPFVLKQFVKEVDLESGRITVDWDPDF